MSSSPSSPSSRSPAKTQQVSSPSSSSSSGVKAKAWTTPAGRKADKAFVENTDILDELLSAAEEIKESSSSSPLRGSPLRSPAKAKFFGNKTPLSSISTSGGGRDQTNQGGTHHRKSPELTETQQLGRDMSRKVFLSKVAQDDALTKYAVQKSIEKKNEILDEIFLSHLDSLDHGRKYMDRVSKELNMFEEAQKNKVRAQMKEWNEKVHNPIAMCIAKKVNAIDPKELNRIKCSDYQHFLNIVNKKPCIFRDIIIESEYDPLEVNKRALVAKVPILNDPTNLDQLKLKRETSMLNETDDGKNKGKQKGEKSPYKTREVLAVELWETGKIESTPYGVAAKMMDSNGPPPQSNPNQTSHVHFNDFQFPKGKEAIDAEMPLGKRCIPQKQTPFSLDQNLPPPERKSKLKTMQAKVSSVIFGPENNPV